MKKTLALLSSLLVIAGLKAQTITIKKETVKPMPVDSLQIINKGISANQTDKAIKFDRNIKVTDKVQKPDKHTPKSIKIDTVKGLQVEKPMKEKAAPVLPMKEKTVTPEGIKL